MKNKVHAQFVLGVTVGIVISILIRGLIIIALKSYNFYDIKSYTKGNELLFNGKKEASNNLKLVLVGVQTAGKYLNNRMQAAYETWTHNIPGDVIFFAGEESKRLFDNSGKPIVFLSDVHDDMYPPQKKSFMMLKYMHDVYLEQYEWFIRADDDVFIIGQKLETFLSSLNSSKFYSIGQGGQGREHERDKLGLAKNISYCMGGPGIILSRSILAQFAQNIEYCLANLYSLHEDTELGRCIYQFTGISCTVAAEVGIIIIIIIIIIITFIHSCIYNQISFQQKKHQFVVYINLYNIASVGSPCKLLELYYV